MRTRTLAALLVVLSVTTAGCVATGQSPPGEAATGPQNAGTDASADSDSPAQDSNLNSRLVVTGTEGVDVSVTVSVRNVTAGNTLVFEDDIGLAGTSRDLSPLLRPDARYTVSVTVDGTTRQYLVSGGQGYRLHVGGDGIVWTEHGPV